MFKRNALLGLRTLILMAVSAALMIANHQWPAFLKIRSTLNMVVLPFQYMVDWPVRFMYWANSNITSQQELLEENAKLRARQLLLEAKLQKLLALERENAQLRELLSSSTHLDGKVVVGQILSINIDPSAQIILVDKGENDGIYVGQPVLDAYGVMGQVISVNPSTSQVLLISDTRSAIPVQDNRTGVRSIVGGLGYSNQLSLLHVPNTADIAVGDVVVTSGLGERFPFGYPVGIVSSIDKDTGDGFDKVIVTPSAHIDRSRQVLLMWPTEDERATETANAGK